MTLYQQQRLNEERDANLGRLEFEAALEKGKSKQREASSIYGIKLLEEVYNKVKPSFHHYINKQGQSKRKAPLYVHVLAPAIASKSFEEVSNVVAFMFGQVLLNKFSGPSYLTSTSEKLIKNLCRSLSVEIDDEHYKAVNASTIQLVRHLTDCIEWMEIKTEPRRREKGVLVGGNNYIQVSETKREEVNQLIERLAPFQVHHKPMIVKPRKHFNLISRTGGYITHSSPLLKRPTKLNKVIHPYLTEYNIDTAEEFFNLINQHQEVGYRINKRIMDAIPTLIKNNVVVDSLDYKADTLLKSLQADAEQEILDKNYERKEKFGDKAFLLSSSQESRIREKALTKANQAVVLYNRTMEIAEEYNNNKPFYFPVFLDNRGRIYYYSKTINPQGNELHKALLEFSDCNLMDDEALIDSLIALGNCLGLDKKTEEVRIKAAVQFFKKRCVAKGDVTAIVKLLDPEQALTGLAITLDILEYYKAKAKGEAYYTHQPLHVDSCNSGSQINGVLLRDETNCRLSNILNVEGDDLEDTYKEVAMSLKNRMAQDDSGMFDYFNSNPQIFERKVFKKSSMTRTNYGAGYLTCSDDIKYQLAQRHTAVYKGMSTGLRKAFVREAVKDIDASLPASNNYKKFAKKLVDAAVKRDGCLAYHNPRSGFPVVLRENVVEVETVAYRELFTGAKKSFNFLNYTNELDATGTASAAVPGITHSFDAAIIVDVKSKCGNIPMTTIHDSIAVLAGHVRSKLLPAIRESYYNMALEDDLATLVKELDVTLEIPYTNDLDIELIKESKHLYS